MVLSLWYCETSQQSHNLEKYKSKITAALSEEISLAAYQAEYCYYVESERELEDVDALHYMLSPGSSQPLNRESGLGVSDQSHQLLVEIGPRLNFSTAFCTNAVSMLASVGLTEVTRLEQATRHLITLESSTGNSVDIKALESLLVGCLHDRMTECRYPQPITALTLAVTPDVTSEVDVMAGGREALARANTELGLAFDDWDLDYYTDLFRNKMKRNPTNVECFDLAQSNSEHSRHWLFKGRLVVDGREEPRSLMQMVGDTQLSSNNNNTIKFADNSSAIEGFAVTGFCPERPGEASCFVEKRGEKRNLIFTAETHNFPTGVAPFPGATTGTGGRIRDVQATGRGAHVIAGTAGYCFGNLHVPGYRLPWEDSALEYPSNLASPLEICIEASNGASDYGNKFGEPVLAGFARSFGLRLPGDGERREWVKPIMFSGGIGAMLDQHTNKHRPETGMEVVKLGGPAYRIGVGGGAASSIQVQGSNAHSLDLGAVQRGDAEMEQKMNRVIRSCVELGDSNPISSIHDQGAGGNGNVLKELVEPAGALFHTSRFSLGDRSLSALELWGAEYQESCALLTPSQRRIELLKLARREKCPVDFVGSVTGDGKIRLVEDRPECLSDAKQPCVTTQPLGDICVTTQPLGDDSVAMQPPCEGPPVAKQPRPCESCPVDLDLQLVLGDMPRKVFELSRAPPTLQPLSLPDGLTVAEALERVLRLPSVASKRYLTNKVDRSVTGLVAQQQCVGPLHTPLADVAVVALSYFDTVGGATSVGEQPIKGLVDAGCGARMAVGEALTNLVFARVTDLKDVKCSANWMWAAKLPGEGALLLDACRAMCDVMSALGVAVDGGKDSLSMAARVGSKTVKAPGSLVVSTYAGCPDITATLTPDLKFPDGTGTLLWVPFSAPGLHRLGGSALAQCYSQLGDSSPDLDDPQLFARAFAATQHLITERKLLSGHDVSDGGLVTCLLEMAFAGNCGIEVDLPTEEQCVDPLEFLFAEELGIVLETSQDCAEEVSQFYASWEVPCFTLGTSRADTDMIRLSLAGSEVLHQSMTSLRDTWEETSFRLEKLQANQRCVEEERVGLRERRAPPYRLTEKCTQRMEGLATMRRNSLTVPPRVCILREEGSNGDREMAAAFQLAGFQAWDVNMQDLLTSAVTLDAFTGLAFVGGFSYADVLGSAKGWAGAFLFHPSLRSQLEAFYQRKDTFSLGVCNGCQLMARLGLVGSAGEEGKLSQEGGVELVDNTSGRFESRFVTVRVQPSPAVMLRSLEGCSLGIWVQHAQGRFEFRDAISSRLLLAGLAPVRYVDDSAQPTTSYPLNPNGSPGGVAALCSEDGRHLAMMPHPERCFLDWQWPWKPASWPSQNSSPWLTMFHDAFDWCQQQQQ